MKKRSPNAVRNVVLGVMVSVAAFADRAMGFAAPTRSRVDKVLARMASLRARCRVTPGEAAVLTGKLSWLLLAVYAHVGRAALQPFMERQYYDAPPYTWTPSMEYSYQFLCAVLHADVIQPLVINYERVVRPPIIVYTDASADSRGQVILGFYILDVESGRVYVSTMVLPLAYFRLFAADKKTYILQGELVAGLAVFFTLPWLFRGRDVVHFVDNVGALAALVHGYARQPDLARFVCSFHAQLVGLRMRWYGDWVPSKANPADVPTRPDRFAELPDDVVWVEMVLPPVELIEADVAAWIALVRAV
jgi:hypothetical protein